MRDEGDQIHLVTLAIVSRQVASDPPLPGQQAILHTLDLPEPSKFLDFTLQTETR